jgi:hypothetical protein
VPPARLRRQMLSGQGIDGRYAGAWRTNNSNAIRAHRIERISLLAIDEGDACLRLPQTRASLMEGISWFRLGVCATGDRRC